MASVDLDWPALDEHLATALVDLLNRQLSSIKKPSFIGPFTVLGFEFGTEVPDVAIMDIRDIHPDFLEDDTTDELPKSMGPTPEFDRFHEPGGEREVFLDHHSREVHSPWDTQPENAFGNMGDTHPGTFNTRDEPHGLPFPSEHRGSASSFGPFNELHPGIRPSSPTRPENPTSAHPDLQLHFHILFHSDLRLTLATSLVINYPSQQFMSLPMKLSITGMVFSGDVVVAYEGSRRRLHLSILDDQDPNGLPTRSSPGPQDSTDEPNARAEKPLPIGQRLLPEIVIESEIGQADKHVLKNVPQVKQFVKDVIRKTVEDELVYPNFLTVELPRPS